MPRRLKCRYALEVKIRFRPRRPILIVRMFEMRDVFTELTYTHIRRTFFLEIVDVWTEFPVANSLLLRGRSWLTRHTNIPVDGLLLTMQNKVVRR